MNKEELKELTETTERSKSNTKRLDVLEDRVENIHNLTLSVEKIANEMKNMREDMNKMDARIGSIEEKPSKRFDLIWGYIVGAIINGLIVFILLKLGLK